MIDVKVPNVEDSFVDFYWRDAEDPNNFSKWYPKVKDHFRTPKTKNFKIPISVANSLGDFGKCEKDPEALGNVMEWLQDVCTDCSHTIRSPRIFVKNARFSNKFDFKTCCTHLNPTELLPCIVGIFYASMCTGALGFTEIVIREFLEYDDAKTYTMYEGMPIRPEYRVFYNFDEQRLVHIHDYWDSEYVASHLYSKNDKAIFELAMKDYEDVWLKHAPEVKKLVEERAKLVKGLNGLWSLDFLYLSEEDVKFEQQPGLYLIDAAIGCQSAYYKPEFEE